LRSRSVVLAANGYAGNAELMARWAPDVAAAEYFGARGSTGEAILWGEQLGAALGNISAYQGYAAIAYPHGSLLSWTTIEKGGILVDRDGRRFGDESIGYSGFTAAVLAAERPIFAIFDTRIRDSAAQYEEEFRELVEIGGTRECPTVAEVADFIGCPPESVSKTLAAYEAAASAQADGQLAEDEFGRTDFGRAPLGPPYVLARVVPGIFHTQGGLQVDDQARVVRSDASIIEGLYAVGGTAAGISGAAGGRGYSSGAGLLAAIGLGAIAGADAATRAVEGS
jgi:fumarate reductase flavoprotein subunit